MARLTKYVEVKLCNSCRLNIYYRKFRLVKPLTKGPNKGKIVGWTDINGGRRFSICKDCEKNKANKRYRLNPIPQLIYSFKRRAKRQKVPFALTVEDMTNLLKNAGNICPVLGVKMTITELGSGDTDYSPSFDRIYPKKGYIKGNIVIVSNKANRIKTDATVDEIRKVADFYEKLLKVK
tara:strand:- start:388 stop:924 length:537 start_codon:yes stop_codon:yes gene_type:complete